MKSLLTLLIIFYSWSAFAGEWRQLPSLPDAEGFAGSYAGVSNGALLVAGGTNFPDKKPWEGGKKVWYDTVFVLESPTAKWKVAGHLPRPLGYGVSVTHNNRLICAGGSDRDRHYADVFRLDWSNGKLSTVQLPSLPQPVANCCGATIGDLFYVAGGIDKPDSNVTLNRAWQIDLGSKSPKWTEIGPWPGSRRMLAVAAGYKGSFWLFGGVDLSAGSAGTAQRHYLTDAFRYDPRNGWKRIADMPHSVVAGPSPAPFGKANIFVLGGDDGLQAANPPDKHVGFGKLSLRYNVNSKEWKEGDAIAAPRATVPCAFWKNSWVMPGGEVRPGVRSPEVWSWSSGTTE